MSVKSLVIKFVLGGAAVALSYIISMVIPWRVWRDLRNVPSSLPCIDVSLWVRIR